jgi:hypothetical protein
MSLSPLEYSLLDFTLVTLYRARVSTYLSPLDQPSSPLAACRHASHPAVPVCAFGHRHARQITCVYVPVPLRAHIVGLDLHSILLQPDPAIAAGTRFTPLRRSAAERRPRGCLRLHRSGVLPASRSGCLLVLCVCALPLFFFILPF